MNTVLPTGPGVWEIRAEGTRRGNAKITPILQAMPTPTHMAIVKLHESGNDYIMDAYCDIMDAYFYIMDAYLYIMDAYFNVFLI